MEYIVMPEYGAERLKEPAYRKARAVSDKWVPVKRLPKSYCGNIYTGMCFDRQSRKFIYRENYWDDRERYASICEVMPTCLWLYRLLCLFQCTVHSEGPEGYKLVWQVALKHKESGEVLVFREWKGGFSLGHNGATRVEVIEKDMLELLNFLVSDQCPHPYDGVLAGSVA